MQSAGDGKVSGLGDDGTVREEDENCTELKNHPLYCRRSHKWVNRPKPGATPRKGHQMHGFREASGVELPLMIQPEALSVRQAE